MYLILIYLAEAAAEGAVRMSGDSTSEAEENKSNLLQQKDTFYATVRKPQPIPGTLERIPGRNFLLLPTYMSFSEQKRY